LTPAFCTAAEDIHSAVEPDAAMIRRQRDGERCATSTRLPYLLDITAVAEHLGVNVRHVRRLVFENRIPYLKWGRLLRFDPDEIAAWLKVSRHPARPA
jgi:excisionase family DNA binding protein